MSTPALELRSLSLSYGANRVLDNVSLSINKGETAALVGENGAGKSSLARIIAGIQRPGGGQLFVDGRQVELGSPRDALENGIAFIPQELIYAPQLTVAENLLLGRIPSRTGFTSQSRILRTAKKIIDEMGFELPLDRPMGELPLMQQQIVEILKAFTRGPKMLVLDEPTAALEATDSNHLLSMIDGLSRGGVGILYISHRLDEVFRSCDSVHVLRGGNLVLSGSTGSLQPREVVHAMLDKSLDEAQTPKSTVTDDSIVLSVQGWNKTSFPTLSDVSFEVRRGEIVGLYGIRGSGAEAVAEGLAGLHRDIRGGLTMLSKPVSIPRSPLRSKRHGISYIPADRKSQGLLLNQPLLHSLTLPALRAFSKLGFIDWKRELKWAQEVLASTRVKYRSLYQNVSELSGGNQQKLLVGSRTRDAKHDLVVIQEPTRGVDVGSRKDIHLQLRDLAQQGTAMLLVSTDLDETVSLADRLLVVHGGQIIHEISSPGPGVEEEIFNYAGGLNHDVQ